MAMVEVHSDLAETTAAAPRPDSETLVRVLGELVEGVDHETLRLLDSEVQWITLPRGALLMRQGDPGDCLYFLRSGRLRVFGTRDDGTEVEMNEVGPGESVGEMALLSREPRSASVAAATECQLVCLSRAGFEALLERHPRAMATFTRVVVSRLSRKSRARAAIAQLRSVPLATVEDCDDVARTPNLVLRNLKITQMYHRLSQELTLLLGHEDANWCTFACNASKTAGYSIRRQELPLYEVVSLFRRRPSVRGAIDRLEGALVDAGVTRRAEAILDAVSASISAGNLKVFAELGPIFARFVRTFHGAHEYDRAALRAFAETLRPGPTDQGGQELLAEALGHYHEAMFELSLKRRCELILLGNIKVGLHEQTRLQDNILEALDAPLRVGLDGLLSDNVLGGGGRLLPRAAQQLVRSGLAGAERRLAERLTVSFRRLVTRSMMTLRLPYGEVRLGADVPRLPGEQMFPDVLREIDLPELASIIRQYDRSVGSLEGSRASDWGDLPDRMNFIIDLFRSRQRSLELFGQPFELDQRREMALDRVPLGRL